MRYLQPTRIIAAENTVNSEVMLAGNAVQPDFDFDNCMTINRGGYILLDFGKEISGGIAIAVEEAEHHPKDTDIRITFGESVMEALSNLGEKNACNDHAVRDFKTPIYTLSINRFANTGFRFVKIEAVSGWVKIKSIAAEPDIRNLEYKGSFECNDELLNEIWKVGAYTVQLNTHEFIWDGVKRDRLVWIGDMHPEVSVFLSVFGYDDAIKNSLELVKNSTPSGEWMNGIATYSVWWMILQYELYMYTGDLEYLKQQEDSIKEICDKVFAKIDGGYCFHDMEGFVDWSSKDSESETEGVKSVFCIGLNRAKRIFDALGIYDYCEKCGKYVEILKKDSGKVKVNKRIAGINIFAERGTEYDIEKVSGASAENISSFFGFYVLIAKCMSGQASECMDVIKEFWGGMLKMGATTFWEDFDIEWMKNAIPITEIVPPGKDDIHGDFGKYCYKGFRHSLCHGWASGPTAVLSNYILGAKITKPGGDEITIKPQIGKLKWVKGDFPTKYGTVHIEHYKENGHVKTVYTAPKEITVVLGD